MEEFEEKYEKLFNVTSFRGIIKSFTYIQNGTKNYVHYIDDIGRYYCFVLVRGIDASYSLTKYMVKKFF